MPRIPNDSEEAAYNEDMNQCFTRIKASQGNKKKLTTVQGANQIERQTIQELDDASLFQRGKISAKLGNHAAALVDFTDLIYHALNTNLCSSTLADYYYERGLVYYDQGDLKPATSDLKTALQLNPNHPNANYYLGQIFTAQNNHAAALSEFQQTFNKSPNNLYAGDYYARGYANYKTKHYREAVEDFKKVIEIEQNTANSALSNYYLGQIYDQGLSIPKDRALAKQYYINAAAISEALEIENHSKLADLKAKCLAQLPKYFSDNNPHPLFHHFDLGKHPQEKIIELSDKYAFDSPYRW